jgi:hypothetical protein
MDVYEELCINRKITPILKAITRCKWDDMAQIKPFLMATLITRSDARSMIVSDDWKAFWYNL